MDNFDIGPDIEVNADEWEKDQEFLFGQDDRWRRDEAREQEEDEFRRQEEQDREDEFERNEAERMRPLDGILLDGKQVFENELTGNLETSDGEIVNTYYGL